MFSTSDNFIHISELLVTNLANDLQLMLPTGAEKNCWRKEKHGDAEAIATIDEFFIDSEISSVT